MKMFHSLSSNMTNKPAKKKTDEIERVRKNSRFHVERHRSEERASKQGKNGAWFWGKPCLAYFGLFFKG